MKPKSVCTTRTTGIPKDVLFPIRPIRLIRLIFRVLHQCRPSFRPVCFRLGTRRTTPYMITFKIRYKNVYRNPLYETTIISRAYA